MARAKLKAYGMAAGLAVLTATGIVGVTVVALGVTLPECGTNGADRTGCAPEQQEIAASAATAESEREPAGAVRAAAPPAELRQMPALPAKRDVTALPPRRESTAVEAAAAAVMADEITTASISVSPARAAAVKPAPLREEPEAVVRAAAEPSQGPAAALAAPGSTTTVARKAAAAPAGAQQATPLPVPEPLAPMAAPDVPEALVATAAPEVQAAVTEAAVPSAPPVVPSETVTIAGDKVNVRATPSISGERLHVFADGTEVTPSGRSGGWAKIADAEGRGGWVDARLLANLDLAALPEVDPPAEAAPEPAPAKAFRTVTGAGVNVRSGPSGGKLFALTAGTRVEVTGEQRGWLNIVDSEGRSGWAYEDYFD